MIEESKTAYTKLPDDIKDKLFEKLIQEEVLLPASQAGWDMRSCILLSSAVIASGLATYVFYKPNILLGADIAADYHQQLGLPEKQLALILQTLLSGSSLTSNFFVNAYFCYAIPSTFWDAVRANPLLSSSVMAQINDDESFTSCFKKTQKMTQDVISAMLKSVPVALSTTQFVALGADSGLPEWQLASLLIIYGLSHWAAVTDCVARVIDTLLVRTLWLCNKETQVAYYDQQDKKAILSAFQETLQQTLYIVRKLCEEDNNTDIQGLDFNSNNIIYDLITLSNTKNFNQGKKPVNLFWINAALFVIMNLCYSAWTYNVFVGSRELCKEALSNNRMCSNNALMGFLGFVAAFPLNYLISVVIAQSNAKKLWNYFTQSNPERSMGAQEFPGTVKAISAVLLFCAAFSWGTSMRLNEQYVKNLILLTALNILTMVFNTFFNAFTIPEVAPGLAIAFNRACGFKAKNPNHLMLENILLTLLEKTKHLTPDGFFKLLAQISGDSENQDNKVYLLLGNKKPSDISTRYTADSWGALFSASKSKERTTSECEMKSNISNSDALNVNLLENNSRGTHRLCCWRSSGQ